MKQISSLSFSVSIKKANQALIEGKTLEDYDLPKKVKTQILARHYSGTEINKAYAQASKE